MGMETLPSKQMHMYRSSNTRQFFYFGYIFLSLLQTQHGAGKHFVNIPPSQYMPFLKMAYWGLIFYNLFQWCIKLSIALLYLRIFSLQPIDRTRYLLFTLIGFMTISYWTLIFIVAFACQPIYFSWNKSIKGHCINTSAAFFVNSICSIIIDAALIIIVLPHILRLNLGRREKICSLFVVSLGFFAIAACALRTFKVWEVITVKDFTWYTVDFAVWSGIECCTAMICGTTLVIKPLLRKIFGSHLNEETASNSKDSVLSASLNTGVENQIVNNKKPIGDAGGREP
jgi:hypothetical protein